MGAAQQIAKLFFRVSQGVVVMPNLSRFPGDFSHFALTAITVAATVVECQSAAQAGFKNRFCAFDEELMIAGDYAYLGCHNAHHYVVGEQGIVFIVVFDRIDRELAPVNQLPGCRRERLGV